MNYTCLKSFQVEEVATIIVNNYKKARQALPILSDKYENIGMHINNVMDFVDSSNIVVAVDNGKIAGFINAFSINDFKGTVKGALSKPGFHGIAEGWDKNYLYTELYRRVSELWVNSECYTHAIMLYLNDQGTQDTWVMNGFGTLVIDAVRPLEEIVIPEIVDTVSIRKADRTDLVNMECLFKGLDRHLASPPIFLYGHIIENYLENYEEWLKIEGNVLWIAEMGGKIIGYLKTNTTEINTDELQDGYTMGINGAYVLPEYRGQHIMARLLNTAIEWANASGLKRCSTDFEAANIDGRRFWLRHFTPYCISMIRRVDERNHLNLKAL